MSDEGPAIGPSRFERTVELPDVWIGEGDSAIDLSTCAQTAALALEYAEKVEAGTATGIDISTLACHCKVLADDLYEAARSIGVEHE